MELLQEVSTNPTESSQTFTSPQCNKTTQQMNTTFNLKNLKTNHTKDKSQKLIGLGTPKDGPN